MISNPSSLFSLTQSLISQLTNYLPLCDLCGENKGMKTAILVDGYNVIYSSSRLKKLLKRGRYQAQEELVRLVSNYCCLEGVEGHIVFDAYRRPCLDAKEEASSKLKVIFTGKGETADSYIERFVSQYRSCYNYIYVITSDYSQGMTVVDEKILVLSSENFFEEIESCQKALKENYLLSLPRSHPTIADYLKDEVRKKLEKYRRKLP